MFTNFDPNKHPFCQIETIKSWLPEEHYNQIDKIQKYIASEVPENPKSLQYIVPVDDGPQFSGRTFHAQPAIELRFLKEIKKLTQGKKNFKLLEIAGGMGRAFWKMVYAAGGQGTCYFNEMSPKMWKLFDKIMEERLSPKQRSKIVKIGGEFL